MRYWAAASSGRLGLAITLSAVAALLAWSDVLWRMDRVVYDLLLRSWQRTPVENILIVAIDERSLQALGRWPWSRRVHAQLLVRVMEGGAAVVGFDVIFADADGSDVLGDAHLVDAVRHSGRVVLPVSYAAPEPGGPIIEILPISGLATAAASLGHVDVEPDEDGIVRAVHLEAGLGEPHWSTFSLAMLERLEPAAGTELPGQHAGRTDDRSPYVWTRDRRILIPFAGPPGTFEQVSFVDVLDGQVPHRTLHGRYILVGVTAVGLGGRLSTPLTSDGEPMSGVEFNANVLDVLLRGLPIIQLDVLWIMLLSAGAALVPALLYPILGLRWTVPVAGGALIATLTGSLVSLRLFQLWFPPSAALLTIILSYPFWSWRQLRKLAHYQHALAEAQQRALVTLHSVSEGVITTDASGRVDDLNDMAERLTGLAVEDARGRPLGEVARIVDEEGERPLELPVPHALLRDSITRLPPQSVLFSLSGERFEVRGSAAPIHGRDSACLGMVLAIADVTDTRRTARRMAYLATHDPLTQLVNRSVLEDRLRHAIANARRTNGRIAILFIDLDRFKTVNDALGHAAGDDLLRAFAARIRGDLREEDTFARIGGDEFAVVLENTAGLAAIRRVLEKIEATLQAEFPIAGHDVVITCSVGVAVHPKDGEDVGSLLRHADNAMYRAKRQGRNNVQFYSDEMATDALDRLDATRDLMRAIGNGDLQLHFQPQVALQGGGIVGVEALLRWHHAELGLLTPDTLIRAAEAMGHSVRLDEWVVTAACDQLVAWRRESCRPVRVAVNVSPQQFSSADAPTVIDRIIKKSGADPSLLEFEISERAIMRDLDFAIQVARDLKSLGVGLAIDDFGIGYSSLNYLVRFPIDRIKIDRSLVHGLERDSGSAAVITGLISMAHGLGMSALAEGVETAAQLEWLESKGCDEAQGYLLGHPMPPDDIAQMLGVGAVLPSDGR